MIKNVPETESALFNIYFLTSSHRFQFLRGLPSLLILVTLSARGLHWAGLRAGRPLADNFALIENYYEDPERTETDSSLFNTYFFTGFHRFVNSRNDLYIPFP